MMSAKIYDNKYQKLFLIVFGFILTLMIGVIRFLTGPELAVSLFYLFPIVLVTWNAGRRAGIIISVTSALSWLMADLMMLNFFSNIIIPFFNETFRLIVFIIITYIIFELKNALEKQKALARIDPLTSVANRRAFFEFADMELNKARRYRHPFSVLYIDIDNFKAVNDSLGHNIGDRLLRSVAKTIKQNIRVIDIIARFGGDEFAILLSETGAEAACSVARKLNNKLLAIMQDNKWSVTFSMGAVTFEIFPDSVDETIKAADSQMYSAKKKGKNRIQHKIITEDRDIDLTSASADFVSL
jgi:diguanylate cyclase (GGDEF)-like protein